jgi:hypothetical protein
MSLTAKRDLASRRGGPKQNNAAETTEVWTVRGATSTDTQYTICACADLPDIGDTDSAGATCTSLDAQETENSSVWKVTVKYELAPPDSNKPPGSSNPADQNQPNPLLRSKEYQWSCVRYPYVPEKDEGGNGKPILNSCGDKFDPPPTIDRINMRVVVTKNDYPFVAKVAASYVDKVNLDAVSIDYEQFAIGTLRMADISSQKFWENGDPCYRISYTLEYKQSGWNPTKIPDVGPNEMIVDPNDATKLIKVAVRDKTGLATGGQVALSSGKSGSAPQKGVRLTEGQNPDELEFNLYEKKAMNGLDL